MNEIKIPLPPPFPDEPVPMRWDWHTPEGKRLRRLHHHAKLLELCPECRCDDEFGSWQEYASSLAAIEPPDVDPSPGTLLTPEGEIASYVHGQFTVCNRDAFDQWAKANFTVAGHAYAYVVDVDGSPWTRALFWFEPDGLLHLESASAMRYFHLQVVFETLWPPVYRYGRTLGPVTLKDSPSALYPAPPAEATAFARLTSAPEQG